MLLKDKAYQAIHEAILNETFEPGELLSEKRLIEYLGMSKTPIKSALDRLESEGFVTVSPKQGILVKDISLDKIRDIFELRLALEPFICERVGGRLRREQIDLLNGDLERRRILAEQEDEAAFTKADADYHILLSRFSGNGEIHDIMCRYQAQLFRSALKVMKRVPNRMQAAYDDHRRIADALIDGDIETAKRLVTEHLTFGKGTLTD